MSNADLSKVTIWQPIPHVFFLCFGCCLLGVLVQHMHQNIYPCSVTMLLDCPFLSLSIAPCTDELFVIFDTCSFAAYLEICMVCGSHNCGMQFNPLK